MFLQCQWVALCVRVRCVGVWGCWDACVTFRCRMIMILGEEESLWGLPDWKRVSVNMAHNMQIN